MIPVNKAFIPPVADFKRLVDQIWKSNQFSNHGKLHDQLSSKLKDYLGVENLELVANGTLAIQLAIKTLKLKGKIITTPYSYVATTNAILWEGCEPTFVDIDPNSFCINYELIEDAIDENTSAILATHVYGYPCNVYEIEKIAQKHNLKVIYDGAHAFGAQLNGKSLLDFGDITTASFHATKLFHTGEGGALISRNKDLSENIYLLSKFGHLGEELYSLVGINAKLSELHAALGLSVFPHIESIIKDRKKSSHLYDGMLNESVLVKPKISNITFEHNFSYYPILLKSHSEMLGVRQSLAENKINSRRYFAPSLNSLSFLPKNSKKPCKYSDDFSQRVLCLPLFSGLKKEQIKKISTIINQSIK
jgi:dTDP-4-amino-4,6-dideoxygalactose transaminase